VAAAAVRRGFVQHGVHTVKMVGGNVEVTVDQEFNIELVGPAVMVYEARGINLV
jgi:diaminopimelate epimerase